MKCLRDQFTKEYFDKINTDGYEINAPIYLQIEKDLYIEWLENKILNNYSIIKQLTVDELKEQFEKCYIENNCENLLSKYPSGSYVNVIEREIFNGYKQCAKNNNVIKE